MYSLSKKEYILLIWCFTLPLLLYSGAIDPFAPLHTVPMEKIINEGNTDSKLLSINICFYLWGSMISLVSGISTNNLIFLPIQLFPSIFLFFILFRELSGSSMISSLFTIIYVITDISGNKFFLWVHGEGLIFLFLILYLLIKISQYRSKIEYHILLFISLFLVVNVSYTITFQILLLLPAVYILLFFIEKDKHQLVSLIYFLIFLIVVQFGLSDFVYTNFIPEMMKADSSLSAIDNFIFNFFRTAESSYILRGTAIVYPNSITIVNSIKYVVLSISITIALIVSLNRIAIFKRLEYEFVVLNAMIFSSIGYFIVKLNMGQFAIGILFYPGIISICLISKFSKNRRYLYNVAIISIAVILVLTTVSYSIYHENNLIPRNNHNFKYIEPSVYWYLEHSNGLGISDVQTNNLYYMYISQRILDDNKKLESINYYFDVFDPSTNKYPLMKEDVNELDAKYFIINNQLQTIAIIKWIILKPWLNFEDEIEMNENYYKIYNSQYIYVLSIKAKA